MPVNEDLYHALVAVTGITAVYDTKLPDGFTLASTVAVFSEVSDVPEIFINSEMGTRAQRWQVSVLALTLPLARAAKEAVIAALGGLSSGAIKVCEFENAPGVIYESEAIPPHYHIPIDFMIYV